MQTDQRDMRFTFSIKDTLQHLNAEEMKFLSQEEIQQEDLTNSIGDEQGFCREVDDDQIVAQIFAHEDAHSHQNTFDTEPLTTFIGLPSRIIDVFVDRFDDVLH